MTWALVILYVINSISYGTKITHTTELFYDTKDQCESAINQLIVTYQLDPFYNKLFCLQKE